MRKALRISVQSALISFYLYEKIAKSLCRIGNDAAWEYFCGLKFNECN